MSCYKTLFVLLALVASGLASSKSKVQVPEVFTTPKADFNITGFTASLANGNASFAFTMAYWPDHSPATCTGTTPAPNGTFDATIIGNCNVANTALGNGSAKTDMVDWAWAPQRFASNDTLSGGKMYLNSRYMRFSEQCQHCSQEGFRYIDWTELRDAKYAGPDKFSVGNWVYPTYTVANADGTFEEL